MKQNFALTLSFDGIGLLHRAFPGWHLVGDVALDVDDLNGELTSLRQTAQLLDASGLRTKLVLPNDQIKYLTIDAPADDAGTVDAVKAALDGATPYPVDDLAYDWAKNDGQISIAAVARETLIEAEATVQNIGADGGAGSVALALENPGNRFAVRIKVKGPVGACAMIVRIQASEDRAVSRQRRRGGSKRVGEQNTLPGQGIHHLGIAASTTHGGGSRSLRPGASRARCQFCHLAPRW